jgi:hypothetical protein
LHLGDAHRGEVTRLPRRSPIPIVLQLERTYSIVKPTLLAAPFAKPLASVVPYESIIRTPLKLINSEVGDILCSKSNSDKANLPWLFLKLG